MEDSSWLEVHLNQRVAVREEQGFVHGKTQVINEFFVTNSCYIVDLAANGVAPSTEASVGPLSWIGICETNSAFPQNFSLMCFHWVLSFVFSEPSKFGWVQ
ncbi:hypothetical protein JHK87_006863 [Glycine soja]|nr:hypothetical protein JHK87_006863 [Glycine soja]